MKSKIGVIIIVVIIIGAGALSGYATARTIDSLFTPSGEVVQNYTEDDVYSVLDKIGFDAGYLSGYSTIQEAFIHSTEPIAVHDLGLTSEEMTALLNMYPELLSSFYARNLSFTIQSDDSVDIEGLVDVDKLRTVTNLPEAAYSMMANTAITINVSFTGVTDDNSVIIIVNGIKAGGMDISSYMRLIVGSNGSGRREGNFLNTEIPLNLGIFSELNTFRIANNMVYIDGTFSFDQLTGE